MIKTWQGYVNINLKFSYGKIDHFIKVILPFDEKSIALKGKIHCRLTHLIYIGAHRIV